MAKTEPKPKWFEGVFQAFKLTRKWDKQFLPLVIVTAIVIIAAGIGAGFYFDSVVGHIYSNLFGVTTAIFAVLLILARRAERAVLNQVDNRAGGSLAALQMIPRGWKFEDEPIGFDQKNRSLVFLGVGRGGIVLVGERGNGARKAVANARKRVSKAAPGVHIQEIIVGDGQGMLKSKDLPKFVRRLPKKLNRRERDAVLSRVRALGGSPIPIPKGVDPTRVRADRRALRG